MEFKSRRLNKKFIDDLKNGILSSLLNRVKKDSTLDLQMRGDSIDIYYRGGKILHLEQKHGYYKASIDKKYFGNEKIIEFKEEIISKDDIQDWINKVPNIKEARDFHYEKRKTSERDYMQLLVRSNSYEKEIKKGNIIITDIEYDFVGKIDFLGLILNNNRQNVLDMEFAFIEGKYATGAVNGKSGLQKHLEDIQKFVSNYKDEFNSLIEDTKEIYMQKIELGLYYFNDTNMVKKINILNSKPKFIIVLADYKINGNNLLNTLNSIDESLYPDLDIKFAVSSLMGYRLYQYCLFNLSRTLEYIKNFLYWKN